ncbi:ABC transporter permease subunit/CPBP intramembrane protease [Rhodopirellula halodulae]|uniref:ABC transporter permease subunit/CPBP intramembrane protease n=1 Tax=Rhodopirellula halodulae TaxID=2894198 RepID=UPI001E4B7DAC|nr:ABC transporter permease subunit/CPBP intramembrane protease [Rhodopirellula sp. JC737]MCC9657438.1 ABC transporter permease subunit [Rhodopirellula sp. JC737]
MSESSKQKRELAAKANRPRLETIGLIYAREMRDQLRDRRTLFTIIVLPILLYPIVGMLLLQIAQFTQQHPISVCVIGVEHVQSATSSDVPPLLVQTETDGEEPPEKALPKFRFADAVSENIQNVNVTTYRTGELERTGDLSERSETWVRDGIYDCVVCFETPLSNMDAAQTSQPGTIGLFYNVASDQSLVARERVAAILNRWRGSWVRSRLSSAGMELSVLDPFQVRDVDIAPERTREAAFWSKLLPFIMLIWAMTGAFYPAIDLVAGEKERGTLETLLCSPTLRSEIVWGKLGAVMSFSMLTAILNACSMLVTSTFVFNQIAVGPTGSMGTPPLIPMLWLFVALVPLSALFSALALAVAAMAKSSKEGQYYLMPLMMLTLPLVLLPMLPGTTLSLGTSLIPVTGMFLLVRTLVEGHMLEALMYVPTVALVTGVCLWLAVQWARRQFESEAVLFGDGDQWELGAWVRHLWRDRQRAATPTVAFACGAIVLVGLFFGKLAVTEMPTTFAGISTLVLVPQLGLILAPTLLMSVMLTTSLRTSLRIGLPSWRAWPVIGVLCVMLHPLYIQLAGWISTMYPLSDQAAEAMLPFTQQIAAAPWTSVILLMAFVPAICEEITFRGFIFGGLVRGGHPLRAVLVTALMFGISHGVLQQSISATFMGLLLGWIALRTGSVLPGIAIHFCNNAMSVSLQRVAELDIPVLNQLIQSTAAGPAYHPYWTACCLIVSSACVVAIYRITQDTDPINSNDALADRLVVNHNVTDPSIKRLATATR